MEVVQINFPAESLCNVTNKIMHYALKEEEEAENRDTSVKENLNF